MSFHWHTGDDWAAGEESCRPCFINRALYTQHVPVAKTYSASRWHGDTRVLHRTAAKPAEEVEATHLGLIYWTVTSSGREHDFDGPRRTITVSKRLYQSTAQQDLHETKSADHTHPDSNNWSCGLSPALASRPMPPSVAEMEIRAAHKSRSPHPPHFALLSGYLLAPSFAKPIPFRSNRRGEERHHPSLMLTPPYETGGLWAHTTWCGGMKPLAFGSTRLEPTGGGQRRLLLPCDCAETCKLPKERRKRQESADRALKTANQV